MCVVPAGNNFTLSGNFIFPTSTFTTTREIPIACEVISLLTIVGVTTQEVSTPCLAQAIAGGPVIVASDPWACGSGEQAFASQFAMLTLEGGNQVQLGDSGDSGTARC